MAGQSPSQEGLECLRNGQIDQAIEKLQQATADYPEDHTGFECLGIAYAQKKAYKDAVQFLKRAKQLCPNKPSVLYNLGVAYQGAGSAHLAGEHFRAVLALDPSYEKAAQALKALDVERKPPDGSVLLFGNDATGYRIIPANHQVAIPERARNTFREEARSAAKGHMGCAFAAIIGLPLLALILFLIDGLVAGDAVPFNTIGVLLLIGAPITFIAEFALGLKTIITGMRAPKNKTPEATVQTFMEAVRYGLWKRAYNCLTDAAQATGAVTLVRKGYLQTAMPNIRVNSEGSLKRCWSGLEFSYAPQWYSMTCESLDDETAMVALPFYATWSVEQEGKEQKFSQVFECPFVVVRRGDFWFLANGFFWPSGG